MAKTKFLGARIESELYDIVNKVAKEENIDKTQAIKILVLVGWKELKLEKALEKYRKGIISMDKAAELAGLTVNEMMQEVAARGIRSDQTIDEFRKGLKDLLQ